MKKKKVILYNPLAVFFDMPLALMAVGSALDRERYEVILIDGRMDPDAHAKVLELAPEAVCVGMTVLTGAPIRDALDLGRKLKARRADLPIVWGGWHASIFPEATLREEATIDVTVQGQGEETFRELVECLADGEAPIDVKGITFRNKGEVVRNPARSLANMDDLPPIDYNLIDVETYFAKKQRRQLDYISSTGCFFRCTFCADPYVFNRRFSAISPERMGAELADLNKRYQFTDVNFQDETFFTYKPRSLAVADAFLENELNATWAGTMRADQCARMTEEEFAHCAKSGLRRVLVGVESGSQEMMDWLKKDIKIEQVWLAAERCARHKVGAIFPFIVGFPGETEKSVQDSLRMARQLSGMSPDFTTPIFYFKPYPGSHITTEAVRNGYQLPENLEAWANFDYVGSAGPWVDDERYRKVEAFKFYNRLASRRNPWWLKPFEWSARQRLKSLNFAFPTEKLIADTLFPRPELS